MKLNLPFSLLMLTLIPSAYAALPIDLSVKAPLAIAHPIGLRPTEDHFLGAELLNQFRRTALMVALGGAKYHFSLQPSRLGEWYFVLLPENGNVHEIETSFPLHAMADWRSITIGGKEYFGRFTKKDGAYIVQLSPVQAEAPETVEVSVKNAQRAVFDAGVPVESLGPQWRLIFESELGKTADLRTFVFIENDADGDHFHIVRTDSIDSEREHIVYLGSQKVSLSMDGQYSTVIRVVP